ncbi:hypothetical protein BJX62DRAFT_227497 [Aspergillus germanicus]
MTDSIIIVASISLALSLFVVCLRCYVRLKLVQSFGRDDLIIIVAMLVNIAFVIASILQAGAFEGWKAAKTPYEPRRALLLWWLSEILYLLASGLVRISIACSLLRIAIDRINKVTLYAICILNSLNTIAFLFFASFQCVPVSGFWKNRQDASCVDATVVVKVTYLYSAISSACDLALGILPIALVWHLSMSWRYKKVALCCFLGAGSLASAAVLIRIPFIEGYADSDLLNGTIIISVLSHVEVCTGIVAGSLPALRPLLRVSFKSTHRPSMSLARLSPAHA